MERETGFEPATLSLGSESDPEEDQLDTSQARETSGIRGNLEVLATADGTQAALTLRGEVGFGPAAATEKS